MSHCFPDELVLRDAGMRGASRLFRLARYYRYVSSYGTVTVPPGFVTDGASIPRMFWSVFAPFEEYFGAAVVHDFLYSAGNTQFSRQEADRIFKEAMFNLGVHWPRREAIFRAVRLFGRSSFRGRLP